MSGVDQESNATGTEAEANGGSPATSETETRAETTSEVPGPWLVWDDSVSLAPLALGWDAEPVVCDWSGRGAPDLLVSAGGGPRGRTARIHHPLGSTDEFPPAYDEGTPVAGLDGLRSLCPIPNGSANRFDLVALADEGLILLPNQGTDREPSFGPRRPLGLPADLGIGPGRVAQLIAVDWDGDGLMDLLVGFDDLDGYWPDGESVPRAQQIGFNQQGGHPGYDRSGAWRGRPPRGRFFWLKNVGNPGEPRWELQEEIGSELGRLDLATRPAPLAVGWSGQRTLELLATDSRGEVRIFRNFGGQRPPVLMEPRNLRIGQRPLVLPDDRTVMVAADIDGDRRMELLFGTADGHVFAIHAANGRDQATEPAPILHETRRLRLGGHAVVTVGDLDDDGDLDLVVGDGAGRLAWVRDLGGPGDHRYASPIHLEAGGEPFRLDPGPDGLQAGPIAPPLGFASPTLVDWTGNGRLDLIVGGAGGDILFFRNNGSVRDPRFDLPVPLLCGGGPLITPPRVRPAVADWSGTGDLDLIALDLQGFLCVYPRVGTTNVGPPVPLADRLGRLIRLDGGFGQSGRCALWAGPWTGPGRTDILVGLPLGSRHVIPAITGEPLIDLDTIPTILLLENRGRDGLVPRPLRLADGRPLVVGTDGCSPSGVDGSGDGTLDLLVGSDAGEVRYYRREELSW